MSSCYFLGIIETVWQRSPPKTTTLPPKGTLGKQRSRKSISSDSMFSLWAMEASFQISSELSFIRAARLDCLPTLHVEDCPQSTGS